MLAELRQEQEQIEEAIMAMERLARGQGKHRGRPSAGLDDSCQGYGQAPLPPTWQQKQTQS